MIDPNDKAYADIGATPMGRMMGQMFRGMVEEGMTRDEALVVLEAYVTALAQKPSDPPKDDA